MWKKIGIGVLVVILALVVVIATRPSTYHVERSATIAAPPGVVFAQIGDFHKWDAWSPWAKLDPNMKTTYEGTQGSPGGSQAWSGNDKAGEGRMTVTAVKPNEQLDIKLEFIKPFASTAGVEFTLAPAGKDTKVTWAMDGENNFVSKAICMFMDMDAMIGKDFEKGLASMKTVAEAAAQQPAAGGGENTPAAVKP